jgi:hypothetical protein
MNWLHVLQNIRHGIGIAGNVTKVPVVSNVVNVLPYGGLFMTILNTVVAIEQAIPAGGMGDTKKTAAFAVVTAAHPEADPQAVSAGIDGMVATLNSLSRPTEKQ